MRCAHCGDEIFWHCVGRKWTHRGRSSWCDETAQGYDREQATPENVECPHCDGTGIIGFPDAYDEPCPDCTPENVECPRCIGTNRTSCDWPDKCWEHASWSCAPCGHLTPENVECQTCRGRRHIEAEYWDLSDPDNHLGWVPCPDCNRSTPENVDGPT